MILELSLAKFFNDSLLRDELDKSDFLTISSSSIDKSINIDSGKFTTDAILARINLEDFFSISLISLHEQILDSICFDKIQKC